MIGYGVRRVGPRLAAAVSETSRLATSPSGAQLLLSRFPFGTLRECSRPWRGAPGARCRQTSRDETAQHGESLWTIATTSSPAARNLNLPQLAAATAEALGYRVVRRTDDWGMSQNSKAPTRFGSSGQRLGARRTGWRSAGSSPSGTTPLDRDLPSSRAREDLYRVELITRIRRTRDSTTASPLYIPQLDEAKGLRADWFRGDEQQERTVQLLESCGAHRVPRAKGQLDIRLPNGPDGSMRYGELAASHYDNTVRIELRNLSSEQAAAVLRALQAAGSA